VPTIEPHIVEYIDSSVKKARKEFGDEIRADLREYKEESKRHMSAVLEKFDESLKAFKELIPSIPTEERIREIVHEEIKPLDTKINFCVTEVGRINKKLDEHGKILGEHGKMLDSHNRKLDESTKELSEHNKEMRRLRLDVNGHDRRINRLELARA
jgi:chromosome segregation ATPase